MAGQDSTFDSRGGEIEQAEAVDRKVEQVRATHRAADGVGQEAHELAIDTPSVETCRSELRVLADARVRQPEAAAPRAADDPVGGDVELHLDVVNRVLHPVAALER